MQEKDSLIGIYNESGELINSKTRKEIDKEKDILKTVNIILTNSKNEVFMILAKNSVWPGRWGGSCAGLVRVNETTEEAAFRTLERELGVRSFLKNVEEKYADFDGVKRIFSTFHSCIDENIMPNSNDIVEGKWVSFDEAKRMIKENKCMPSFELSLENYLTNFFNSSP